MKNYHKSVFILQSFFKVHRIINIPSDEKLFPSVTMTGFWTVYAEPSVSTVMYTEMKKVRVISDHLYQVGNSKLKIIVIGIQASMDWTNKLTLIKRLRWPQLVSVLQSTRYITHSYCWSIDSPVRLRCPWSWKCNIYQ